MSQSRNSRRKRTALRSLAVLLVALGVLAFAATIAVAVQPAGVGGGPPAGTPQGDEGDNNDPEACGGYLVGRACKIDVCNPGNGDKTISIDYNAYLNGGFTLPPCDTEEEEEDPFITVCRDGVVTEIRTSARRETDTAASPCPIVIVNDITVCRDGVSTVIPENTRREGDTNPPCITGGSDPEISVCRSGAVITILTSAKLATDTTPPCPIVPGSGDSGAAPGAADAGGPVDQGDAAAAGVEYPHDSLAPTNAAQDGPGAGPEYAVAGAADAAATVPGSGISGAAAPVNGQLPYTGLSTLQVALLGTMLLGMGAFFWLIGTPRTEEIAAA